MIMDRRRCVYFAKCIGPTGEPFGAYKVGCSSGLTNRIQQIGICEPFTLEVEATVEGGWVMEAAVHLTLAEHRIAGEYFHARGKVLQLVERCRDYGSPFDRIEDHGAGDHLPDDAFHAFIKYHGVTLDEVCKFLGYGAKSFEKRAGQKGFRARKPIAAAALIAARRGQYVSWPVDALKGLLGEEDHILVRNREEALSTHGEAA